MKPLVKWAGGKRQLLPEIMGLVSSLSWDTYFEPFAGGLALLVKLHSQGRIGKAFISDLNPELINLYSVVKNVPMELLEWMEAEEFRNDEDHFYRTRDRFNLALGNPDKSVERAALFLYLNRHSFNGLWRVNGKGFFNVPYGRYVNPKIPCRQHILEFSSILKNVDIENLDFSEVVRLASEKDFIYFDPPYSPLSRTSNFTDYAKGGFKAEDQERLLEACEYLEKKRVRFLLSNSYSGKVAEMYENFNMIIVSARRNINRDPNGRTGQKELLITNMNVESQYSEIILHTSGSMKR